MDDITRLQQQLAEAQANLARVQSGAGQQIQAKTNEANYLREQYEQQQLARLGQQGADDVDMTSHDWFNQLNLFPKPPVGTTTSASSTGVPGQIVMGEDQLKKLISISAKTGREAAREEFNKQMQAQRTAAETQAALGSRFYQEEPELANSPQLREVVNTVWAGMQQAYPTADPSEIYQKSVAAAKGIIGNVKATLPPPVQVDPRTGMAMPQYNNPYAATEYTTHSQAAPMKNQDPVVTDVPGNQQPDWINNIANHNSARNAKFSF